MCQCISISSKYIPTIVNDFTHNVYLQWHTYDRIKMIASIAFMGIAGFFSLHALAYCLQATILVTTIKISSMLVFGGFSHKLYTESQNVFRNPEIPFVGQRNTNNTCFINSLYALLYEVEEFRDFMRNAPTYLPLLTQEYPQVAQGASEEISNAHLARQRTFLNRAGHFLNTIQGYTKSIDDAKNNGRKVSTINSQVIRHSLYYPDEFEIENQQRIARGLSPIDHSNAQEDMDELFQKIERFVPANSSLKTPIARVNVLNTQGLAQPALEDNIFTHDFQSPQGMRRITYINVSHNGRNETYTQSLPKIDVDFPDHVIERARNQQKKGTLPPRMDFETMFRPKLFGEGNRVSGHREKQDVNGAVRQYAMHEEQLRFNEIPPFLFIQLKRFTNDNSGNLIKIPYEVENVPDVLTLNPLSVNNQNGAHYRLVAVSTHRGDSLQNGHYVSYNFRDGQVFERDDIYVPWLTEGITDEARKREIAEQIKKQAYCLMYVRI